MLQAELAWLDALAATTIAELIGNATDAFAYRAALARCPRPAGLAPAT
jgi:hypothetical protein